MITTVEKIEKTKRGQCSVYLQFTSVVMVVMLPDQGHLNPGLRENRLSHSRRRNILGGDESTHTPFLTSERPCWFSDCVNGAALTRCNIVGTELKDVTQGSAHSSVVECWPNTRLWVPHPQEKQLGPMSTSKHHLGVNHLCDLSHYQY